MVRLDGVPPPAEPAERLPQAGVRLLAAGLRARVSDRIAVGARRSRTPATSVLCLDYQYNLPAIARELERAGTAVHFWWGGRSYHRLGSLRSAGSVPDTAPAGELFDPLWEAAASDDQLRDLLRWDELDLWSVVRPRLNSRGRVGGIGSLHLAPRRYAGPPART